MITSTFENVSDIGVCLGLSLGPPAIAGVRSKQGAVHLWLLCTGRSRWIVEASNTLILAEGAAMKVLLAVACAMLLTVAVVQVSKDQASTGISVAQLGKGKGKGKAPAPPPIVSKG